MKADSTRWVVDASVGIKLVLPEDYSPKAEDLFSPVDANQPIQFFVPDLFFIECANILWKQVRRFGYSAANARKDINELKGLNLKVVPTAELMATALDLALKLEITAYDGCYLALAQELDAPLVTADEKLFKRIKSGNIPARWIGDI